MYDSSKSSLNVNGNKDYSKDELNSEDKNYSKDDLDGDKDSSCNDKMYYGDESDGEKPDGMTFDVEEHFIAWSYDLAVKNTSFSGHYNGIATKSRQRSEKAYLDRLRSICDTLSS